MSEISADTLKLLDSGYYEDAGGWTELDRVDSSALVVEFPLFRDVVSCEREPEVAVDRFDCVVSFLLRVVVVVSASESA